MFALARRSRQEAAGVHASQNHRHFPPPTPVADCVHRASGDTRPRERRPKNRWRKLVSTAGRHQHTHSPNGGALGREQGDVGPSGGHTPARRSHRRLRYGDSGGGADECHQGRGRKRSLLAPRGRVRLPGVPQYFQLLAAPCRPQGTTLNASRTSNPQSTPHVEQGRASLLWSTILTCSCRNFGSSYHAVKPHGAGGKASIGLRRPGVKAVYCPRDNSITMSVARCGSWGSLFPEESSA